MKFRTFTYAAAIYVSLFSALPCPTWAEPIFTSIKEADCHDPSSSITAAYDAKGLTVQECAAVKGWQLFVASSDERSWIDIGRGSSLWSIEKEVVYNNDFGFFPNIGGSVAEWVTAGGVPSSLIFRIAAQDDNLRRVSRLFVIDLKGREPAFCGVAKTNQEARALAATKGGCKRRLLPAFAKALAGASSYGGQPAKKPMPPGWVLLWTAFAKSKRLRVAPGGANRSLGIGWWCGDHINTTQP